MTTTSTNDPLFSLNAAASAALQTPQQQQGKSSNPYSWTPATNASYGSPQYDMSGLTQPSIGAGGAGGGAAAGLGSTAYQQQTAATDGPTGTDAGYCATGEWEYGWIRWVWEWRRGILAFLNRVDGWDDDDDDDYLRERPV